MKKRLLSALLALTLMLALLPAVPAAERQEGTASLEKVQEAREVDLTAWDGEEKSMNYKQQCGDTLYYTYDQVTKTLTIEGSGAMWESWEYPSYTMPWATYCDEIAILSLPVGLTYIAAGAFMDCQSLLSLKVPEGVEKIGYYAFEGCSNLKEIFLPSTLKQIAVNSFHRCDAITSIEVANGNLNYTSLDGVLYTKDLKTLVKFPSGLTSSFTVPDHVIRIMVDALCYTCLSEIIIPDTVKYVGQSETDTTSITDIENGLTLMGNRHLTFVQLPASMTTLPATIFKDCTSLSSVDIPSNVKTIGRESFEGCSSLTSIIIPACVLEIGSLAFSDTASFFFCGRPPKLEDDSIGPYQREDGKYWAPTFYYQKEFEEAWENFHYMTNVGAYSVRVLPWGTVDAEELTGTLTAEQLAAIRPVDGVAPARPSGGLR